MKNNTRKIIAIICLIMVLFTSLPLQTFATFITDINSNAQFGVIPGSLASYGHELHYANYDGGQYLVFCTHYGMTSPGGGEYTYNGDFIVHQKMSAPDYEKIAEMIYFGYTMNYGMGLPGSDDAIRAACCTQQYVWEYIHDHIDPAQKVPARESWNGNYMSTGHLAEWTAKAENYYNQYHGNVSFNGTSNKVILGDTTIISDSNGRLASYKTFSQTIDGVTFSHNQGSNDLMVSVAEDSPANNIQFTSRDYGLYQLMPNGSEYSPSTMSNYIYIQFTSGTVQNLIFSNYVDPSAFSISVEVESGNMLVVKTNTTGNVIGGCTFDLYRDAGCTQKIRTGTSDGNGQVRFDRLPTGTFYLKETSVVDGYLLNTEVKPVRITAGETAEVYFENQEPTGEISISKIDRETGNTNRVDGASHHGDATLKGAVYTLFADSDIYNKAGNVKYFSKNETIGTYTFDEYGKATAIITNGTTAAHLGVNGGTITGLPMGNYYTKETAVPAGYMQDTNKYNYTLSYKDSGTAVIRQEGVVQNQVQKAKFEVIKVSSVENKTAPVVDNAEFTAILTKYVDYYGSFDEALKHLSEFSEDEYSIFKTGSNGHGVSGRLAWGEYTVNETYTPSDKINTVETFYVTIDQNSDGVIKELVENDTPFESFLKMKKVDKKTGKAVTLSNAIFKVLKLQENGEWKQVGCKVGKETFTSWTTDENGIAYTETKLKGGTYKIEELQVPNGFLDMEDELIFEVSNKNKTLEYDKDFDAYITVTVQNEQPTGTIEIEKSVADREDIDTTLADYSDLSGIKFRLSAKEDIIDMADGSTIYEKGQEIKVFNLAEDGKYIIDNLPMGLYELQEIETLKGLVLDNTKYEVKLEQKDTITKVYIEKEEIENYTTVVEFSKTDITGDKELEGAELTVVDEEGNEIDKWTSTDKTHKIEGLEVNKTYILREEIAPDGFVKATEIEFKVENTKEIQKVTMVDKIVEMSKVDIGGEEIEGAEIQVLDKDGNIIDSWISEKEAHKIKGLEEGKTYILHEEVAKDGYVKATDIEFTVTEDKETQKVTMIDKIVEMSKIDIGGKEIEGAEIQVLDKDGNIVDSWISEKEAHKIRGLEEGKTYILHEEVCAEGFVKATDIEFTVFDEKKNEKIEMIDKVVTVTKTDATTSEELEGAELVVTDEDGNEIDRWTSTNTPHKVNGLEEGKKYTLTEIICPYGYEQAESIEFTVSYDKETQKIEMKDMPILKTIKLIKADEDTKEVIKADFSFGIYEDSNCTKLIKEVSSDKENGTVSFEDLRYGEYYIKELKQPANYQLSDKVVKIEINDKGTFADGVLLEDNDSVCSFTFFNKQVPKVQTGSETNLGLLVSMIAVSLLGIIGGVVLLKKKSKKSN